MDHAAVSNLDFPLCFAILGVLFVIALALKGFNMKYPEVRIAIITKMPILDWSERKPKHAASIIPASPYHDYP